MSKKIVILAVFVLLLVIGGVFLWKRSRKITGSPDDYKVLTTEEGVIVENKRAGLRVKVPDGWTVEKVNVMEGSMVFYSPDAEGVRTGEIRPPLGKGCLIETAVAYKKMSFAEIKKEIEQTHQWLAMVSDTFNMVTIDGSAALKNNNECAELGPSIDVYIPTDTKMLGFGLSSAPQEAEKCSQEFDNFLAGISIK